MDVVEAERRAEALWMKIHVLNGRLGQAIGRAMEDGELGPRDVGLLAEVEMLRHEIREWGHSARDAWEQDWVGWLCEEFRWVNNRAEIARLALG